MKETHRIPYDARIHSQLSVAKYYGGINIQGKSYVYDHETMKKMADSTDENENFKPDLVLYE